MAEDVCISLFLAVFSAFFSTKNRSQPGCFRTECPAQSASRVLQPPSALFRISNRASLWAGRLTCSDSRLPGLETHRMILPASSNGYSCAPWPNPVHLQNKIGLNGAHRESAFYFQTALIETCCRMGQCRFRRQSTRQVLGFPKSRRKVSIPTAYPLESWLPVWE